MSIIRRYSIIIAIASRRIAARAAMRDSVRNDLRARRKGPMMGLSGVGLARTGFLLCLPAAIGIAAPAPATADALQDQLLAAARATRADAYSFRRTLVLEGTGSARKVVVEQFDPRRPPADQWTLVSIDGRPPTAKETAQSRKSKRGPTPSYAQLAKWIGAPATRSDVAGGAVLYRFARLPAGTLKLGSHDASADTHAEALVNTRGKTPYVERVRLTSTKGFRMMLVASVQSMAVDSRYRQLPDGTAVPASVASDITGSMMGKAGQLKTETTYTDVQRVR